MSPDAPLSFEDSWRMPSSTAHRIERGRAERKTVPRSSLATLTGNDRDPLSILDRQNAARVPDLVPIRTERMAASPFAFYRGTAALQAADMADDPHSGILVPSCGDAHVANFGFYASPQRTLVFDLNDFDEAAWAPWEWDVKRLVTSVVVAGQATSRDEHVITDAALSAVRTYAAAMTAYAGRSAMSRYFDHFDLSTAAATADPDTRAVLKAAMKDARRRTGDRATRRLTQARPDGRMVFAEHPPTMVAAEPAFELHLRDYVARYTESAGIDIQVLLTNYTVSDIARRVVGVGSVGTRCALVLFQDGDGNALILQAKQANRSVLEEYGGIEQPGVFRSLVRHHGQGVRVVSLQRTLQAFSDPFLGHLQTDDEDFYVRQFHDMKGGIDAEQLDDRPFQAYAESCAATLARAHAQSTRTALVAGYVGGGRVVGEAIVRWAYDYAAVSKRDYDAFVAATSAVPPGPGPSPAG